MTAIKPYREKSYGSKLPRQARKIICERCGTGFLVRTCGRTKYCIECKVIVYDERNTEQKHKKQAERRLLALSGVGGISLRGNR